MACCTETAYSYRKLILPYANQHILDKNKIRDAHKVFNSDLGWVWGHLHVLLHTSHGYKVHDAIIHRSYDNRTDIHDSFIGHRDISQRSYQTPVLCDMWSIFSDASENIDQRKLCYNLMFDAPKHYSEGWDGAFECWLIRLT